VVVTTQAKTLKARARIGSGGRLVIPAEIRRELGLEEGEPVVMRVVDGELRLWSLSEGIRRAQAIVRRYVPPGVSLADELIAERRAENAREEEELREWEAAHRQRSTHE
jgi:AbrB family looped-hinge helix DNA binding protein